MNTVDLVPIVFVGGVFLILVGRLLLEYTRVRSACYLGTRSLDVKYGTFSATTGGRYNEAYVGRKPR